MAKRTGEYTPDDETLKRLMLYLNGNGSAEDEAYLSELYQRDPNFAYYYKRAKAAMGRASRSRTGQGAIAQSARPGLNSRLQQRNYGGQASGRTISPGGFKKSGLDIDAERIRSGESTVPAAFQDIRFDRNSNIIFNGRKYSPRQVEWIKRRAMSGATLSADQQTIYDATVQARNINAQRRAAARAQAEAERKNARAAAEADRADITKRLRDRADLKFQLDAKNKAAREEYEFKQRFEADQKKAAEDAKKAAEDAKFEALNSKHGLAAGTRLSQKDYDDLEAGRKKYGYSRRDQEAVDKIRSDLDDARRSLIFNSNEWNRVTQEADDAIARFDKRLIDKPREERTAQDIIGEAAQNGGYYMDPSGKMVYLRDEEAERAAKVEDRDRDERIRIATAAENARMSALRQARADYKSKAAYDKRLKDWQIENGKDETDTEGYVDPAFDESPYGNQWTQNYIRNVQGNMALLGGDASPAPTVTTVGYTCPACQSQMPSPNGPCPVCGWPTQGEEYMDQEYAAPSAAVGDWTAGFGGVDPRATYEEE